MWVLWHLTFAILCGIPGVWAGGGGSGWDDFTDNLATDLAPLIALFGDRLTKQFLSESTSLLDNFIFSLAPLGILTAVVSVIRVGGTSSLRAFVGRAQEGPADVEHELLSCVSDATAELFNDGGISRVFGRPRILEVVVWEEVDPQSKEKIYRIGTLREALHQDAWYAGKGEWSPDEKGSLPELEIPNLSLNKGIKPRSRGWFYMAALLGVVLQIGTLAYAALTKYLFPARFKKDDQPVEGYAFPLYFVGTIFLDVGMFLCAFIIERSTSECYLYPRKPSKIYWLQPGRQTIGDQDFGAFLGVSECPKSRSLEELVYIKSIKNPSKPRQPLLFTTIVMTMVGFVLQFVGLRGLHASVILAAMGSTLVMAIVRASLRTKRIGTDANHFDKNERELTSYNQQELDCFAFHLENVKTFFISSTANESPRSRSGSHSSRDTSQSSVQVIGLVKRLVETRARLAELTSNASQHESMDWNDLPIRQIAHDLAHAIERTMDVVSRWKDMSDSSWSFELSFTCQPLSPKVGTTQEAYPIKLKRSEDTLQWKVDADELEAVLGLWTFSILKLEPKWRGKGLSRRVGLTKSEASSHITDLYFHKWIFRYREARMVSSKTISFPGQMFGYYSEEYPDEKEILVVKTENGLETMAAQDIYIQFLLKILQGLGNLGGHVDVCPWSQGTFFAQSIYLDELVDCFTSGNLGPLEDALLCIVPVLKHHKLLPELAADSSSVKMRVANLISTGNWREAFSIVQWLCERCEGEEFNRSVYELGLLCQRAMLHHDSAVRKQGFEIVSSLLQADIRVKFFENLRSFRSGNWMEIQGQAEWWARYSRQLGWITWHIANSRADGASMKTVLESLGVSRDLEVTGSDYPEMKRNIAQHTLLGWLIPNIQLGIQGEGPNYQDEAPLEICVEWILQDAQPALCHWLFATLVKAGENYPPLVVVAFVLAAKFHSESAIHTLRQCGADINTRDREGSTPLIRFIILGNIEACKLLLAQGADANACTKPYKVSPLGYAAGQGNEAICQLLLHHRADLESRCEEGYTPFHLACRQNYLNIARLLLDRGADMETPASDGRTPLINAVADGYPEMVEFLLQRGANVDAQDTTGCTALIRAASERSTGRFIRVLLDRGADVAHKNHLGETAYDRAMEMGYVESAAILKAASGEHFRNEVERDGPSQI